MSFSFRQTAPGSAGGAAQVTFSSTPLVGNLVVVEVGFYGGIPTAITVQDNNGNTYTKTTGSPFPNNVQGLVIWLLYWVVTGTPSPLIKLISQTGTGNPGVAATEFNVTGGTPVFDTDVGSSPGGNPLADSAGNIATPSITPAGAGELLFAACDPNGSIIAPTAGGSSGGWTGAAIDSFLGWATEYILSSASGATATSFKSNTANDWYVSAIAAFKQVSAITPSFVSPASRYGSKGRMRTFSNVR